MQDAGEADLPEDEGLVAPEFKRIPAAILEKGERLSPPDLAIGRRDVVATLRALAKRHGEAYVIDLEGLRDNEPDVETLAEAARKDAIWMDAGSRGAEDATHLLISGASRITIRYSTLASWEEFLDIFDDSDTTYLGIEFADGILVPNRGERLPLHAVIERAREEAVPLVAIDLPGPASASRSSPHARIVDAVARYDGGEVWYVGPVAEGVDEVFKSAGFAGVASPIGGRA